jgi:hypothetical protein
MREAEISRIKKILETRDADCDLLTTRLKFVEE